MIGKKYFYIGLGLITSGLGILGVWLPGLPTTVFILIALWAFSRSSPKLHRWLSHLPILKHALKEAHRYERERTIAPAVKIVSQSSAWISAIAVLLVTRNLILGALLIALAVGCSVFMYLTPSSSAIQSDDSSD